MYIVVITGSPHKNGTSAWMADAFIRGAEENGHTIFRFDAAHECVHPCIGCDVCQCGKAPCVFQDSMHELYPELVKTDMVVFVSPLYYHAVSSQIKMVIDRFHGIDDLLRGTAKKAMLIMTSASKVETIFTGAVASYRETLKYLGWEDCGILLADGCYTRGEMEATDHPQKAYELGRSIK